MLEQSSTFKKLMRQLIMLSQIAGRASKHNIVNIMAGIKFSPTYRNGVLKMEDVSSVFSLKFSMSASSIVAAIMLALQLLLDLMGGQYSRDLLFKHPALVIVSAKNCLSSFTRSIALAVFDIQLSMGFTIVSGVFLIPLALASISGVDTILIAARCIVASFSCGVWLFVISIVLTTVLILCFLVKPMVVSSFLVHNLFVFKMVPLTICFSFLSMLSNILPIILAFLFSMFFGILQAIESVFLSIWSTVQLPTCFAVRAQPIFMGSVSAKHFGGCREKLLTRTSALFAGNVNGVFHDRNCLSFLALSSCCQGGKATTFSSGLITPSLGNSLIIHSFSLLKKREW